MPLPLDKHDPQRDLLRHVLRGEKLTPADIDHLVAHVKEDIHLDYKSGAVLDDERGQGKPGHPKTFHGKVKKHVAGLANADGGVLVIGVCDPQHAGSGGVRQVDGCQGAAEELVSKVKEAVKELRPYLTGHTPVHVVEHPEGLVLVVGVDKSDSRVLVVEGGRTLHYLRLHDSTTHAPEYLVEDLVLGRWRRPDLRWDVQAELRPGKPWLLSFAGTLRNVGMTYADNPRVGLVVPTPDDWPNGNYASRDFFHDVSDEVAQAVVILESGGATWWDSGMVPRMVLFEPVIPRGQNFLATYEKGRFELLLAIQGWGKTFWAAVAVFVVARSCPPTWYQLLVRRTPGEKDRAYLLPSAGMRPRVGLHAQIRRNVWDPAADYFDESYAKERDEFSLTLTDRG